jgi:8-oxo-dGTP diphosphatase
MKKDQFFYVGQKALIRKGNEVLVLGAQKGRLDYPGGKIQEGEHDLAEALKREVREETGLEISVGKPFATWIITLPVNHRLAGRKIFLVAYRCEYVSGEINLSDEHDSFSWVTKENYRDVDDGTPYFKILEEYFNL